MFNVRVESRVETGSRLKFVISMPRGVQVVSACGCARVIRFVEVGLFISAEEAEGPWEEGRGMEGTE